MKKFSDPFVSILSVAFIIIACLAVFSCYKQVQQQSIPADSRMAGANKDTSMAAESGDPVSIDLQSKLTQPASVVVQSGCVATYNATLQITNPSTSPATADFTVAFYSDNVRIFPFVASIDNETNVSHVSTQTFHLAKGKTVSMVLTFTFSNQAYDFNRSYVVNASINPLIGFGNTFSFIDPNSANDLLTQETFIGSPNTICSKCLETAGLTKNVQYSFFIPGINYANDCKTFLAFLSSAAELVQTISKADEAKTYFQFIPNGFIPNTTINSVLIKNGEGKYLTYNNGVPTFMAQISNDSHGYQRWVVVKPSPTACGNHKYKFVQYLDNNNCKELVQTSMNNRYYLAYRSGISADNIVDKFIMEPKAQVVVNPNIR